MLQTSNLAICIGVSQKPITDDDITNSDKIWILEYRAGQLCPPGDALNSLFSATDGDSIIVEYNSTENTLSYGKSEGQLIVAFHDVRTDGKELFPVLIFDPVCECVAVSYIAEHHECVLILIFNFKVKFSAITEHGSSELMVKEQLNSGYPFLSTTSVTLTQAIVTLIHVIQENKVWSKAIRKVRT